MLSMTDDERRELGQKIKTARKQKGLSQEQLAELVGYKVGTISKYEQGYRIPSIAVLRKIAEVLECNLSELAGDIEDVIGEISMFEETTESYITWLRNIGVSVSTPLYDEDNKIEKMAIILDVDSVAYDVGDKIDDIMEMSKDHFKLLAKQFGERLSYTSAESI